jgi:hypothetical protein
MAIAYLSRNAVYQIIILGINYVSAQLQAGLFNVIKHRDQRIIYLDRMK